MLKGDREALKGNGEALKGDRNALNCDEEASEGNIIHVHVQTQTVITSHLNGEQLQLFNFARQYEAAFFVPKIILPLSAAVASHSQQV